MRDAAVSCSALTGPLSYCERPISGMYVRTILDIGMGQQSDKCLTARQADGCDPLATCPSGTACDGGILCEPCIPTIVL